MVRVVQAAVVGLAVASWLAAFGCITYFEWVRPVAPDPAHGYVHRLKGWQRIVYVNAREDALKTEIVGVAFAATIAFVVAGALRR